MNPPLETPAPSADGVTDASTPHELGLVFAFLIAADGAARRCDWDDVKQWRPGGDTTLWVHLDGFDEHSRHWLIQESGLSDIVSDALLAAETRPRATEIGDGVLVILRGVNPNPRANPEDMVALRLWLERDRVVTVRRRRLRAVEDVRDALDAGKGPHTADRLLVALADRLVDRTQPVIAELEDEVDALEDALVDTSSAELRRTLGTLRRQTVTLRRHIAPQRDALAQLQMRASALLSDASRLRLREVADAVTRYVEDLDATRDRAAVLHEELAGRLSEHMNRTMYVLSLVTGVFLPLGLITGLFGINVGGMPGIENPMAFTVVTAVLVGLAVLQVLLFRWLRYL